MLMKLISEGMAQPFSDSFFDTENEDNYYVRGVSPYISQVFSENEIGGESWDAYAACYMWGTTGVLYNPEYMTAEEAGTWAVFGNSKFRRQLTLKDNVRDTYFAALGYLRAQELTSEEFLEDPDYQEKLAEVMNDVSPDTIDEVEELLQDMMRNVYALETDSGKADMVTGKIIANYQWSGDAVYAMDQAEEDGVYLAYAVPEECTNLWFDGWLMLKKGIAGDEKKQAAAEAFVNFLSRPDNAVRNMYYIGYTSSIAGGDDDTVFSYVDWCYGAEDDEESTPYDLSYFFSGDEDTSDYIIDAGEDQVGRQLYTQYPSKEIIGRTAIMGYFDETETKNLNQMWINIRCFNIGDVPAGVWIFIVLAAVVLLIVFVRHKNNQMWR
jgi:spermidine/putrescine transport system substrate-binding protein